MENKTEEKICFVCTHRDACCSNKISSVLLTNIGCFDFERDFRESTVNKEGIYCEAVDFTLTNIASTCKQYKSEDNRVLKDLVYSNMHRYCQALINEDLDYMSKKRSSIEIRNMLTLLLALLSEQGIDINELLQEVLN